MRFLPLGLLALAGWTLPFCPAHALMTYGGTNSTNTTDPGNGLPWNNVVAIEDGSGLTDGSGIYLGNQFVLTANHVGPVSQINMGGILFSVDTSFNASYTGGSFSGGFSQIGNTDLKLVRLTLNPATNGVSGLQTINLNSSSTLDVNSLTTNYLVGYGVGKGAAITGGWNWDSSPGTQRWGTNNVGGTQAIVNGAMTTNTLLTQFNSISGANEAAITLDDSGGALFFQNAGTWYLSGVSLYVSTNGTSYYTGDPNASGAGSINAFGRISSYETLITSATAVPEPSTLALVTLGLGALVYGVRRRF